MTDHQRTAELLRSNPGQWIEIAAYGRWRQARTTAHQIKKGTLDPYQPPGAFEARVSHTAGDRGTPLMVIVRARYVATDERNRSS